MDDLRTCIADPEYVLRCIDYLPNVNDCDDNADDTAECLEDHGFESWSIIIQWCEGGGHETNLTVTDGDGSGSGSSSEPELCLIDWGDIVECFPWEEGDEPSDDNLPPGVIDALEDRFGKTVCSTSVVDEFEDPHDDPANCSEVEGTFGSCLDCCVTRSNEVDGGNGNGSGSATQAADDFFDDCYDSCRSAEDAR